MNLGNKNSIRGTLSLVLTISVGLHVLGLVVFGVVRIAQELTREEVTFEAPPIAPPPEEVPPPPNLQQRNQESSPPRPNPITVDTPNDIDLPALDIDLNVDNASAYGRGSGGFGNGAGGGLSQMREMSLDLDFFGAKATGSNLAFVLDCTHSGAGIFAETREELIKTVNQMRESLVGQFHVVYFGGALAGHITPRNGDMAIDPTQMDYRFPEMIRERQWVDPTSDTAQKLIDELNGVDPNDPVTHIRNGHDVFDADKGHFFILGTQYWGAINATYNLRPAPDTVFFLVEPSIAFPSVAEVKESYEWFAKHGRKKPSTTTVKFVICRSQNRVNDLPAARLMANLVHGGNLTEAEIDELMVFTE